MDGIQYSNKAVLVIARVREEGIREILGAMISDCEDELTREDLFSDLKDRGLRHIDMVVSDGHKGIQKAMGAIIPWSLLADVPCSSHQGCIKESSPKRSQNHSQLIERLTR